MTLFNLRRETRPVTTVSSNGKAPGLMSKPKEVLTFARQAGLHIVDLKFVDFLGLWRRFPGNRGKRLGSFT
jgi:hypothetical protein